MNLNFKMMRSFIGKRFNENQQMRIVVFLSGLFWGLRKYFLGVERDENLKFSNHWKKIKIDSSLDKERTYNLYQFILFHNETFKNQSTNALEFGVSRGSSLKTISAQLLMSSTVAKLPLTEFQNNSSIRSSTLASRSFTSLKLKP